MWVNRLPGSPATPALGEEGPRCTPVRQEQGTTQGHHVSEKTSRQEREAKGRPCRAPPCPTLSLAPGMPSPPLLRAETGPASSSLYRVRELRSGGYLPRFTQPVRSGPGIQVGTRPSLEGIFLAFRDAKQGCKLISKVSAFVRPHHLLPQGHWAKPACTSQPSLLHPWAAPPSPSSLNPLCGILAQAKPQGQGQMLLPAAGSLEEEGRAAMLPAPSLTFRECRDLRLKPVMASSGGWTGGHEMTSVTGPTTALSFIYSFSKYSQVHTQP